MIVCIRIYNNNSFIRFRSERQDEVDKWIAYNKSFRPGTALVVDGAVLQKGYLSDEQIAARVAEIDKKPHYPWTENPLRRGGSESVYE